MPEKPLFIVLRRQYYEAFKRGDKTEEYRVYGERWNERTCRIGRKVTLSLGYGKHHRLHGVISGFRTTPGKNCPGWAVCYGVHDGLAACIRIEVTH